VLSMVRNRSWLAILLLVAACSSAQPPTTTAAPPSTTVPPTGMSTTMDPWTPPLHRVYVADGRFVDRLTGQPFVVRGVNYFQIQDGRDRAVDPAYFDADGTAADFALLASLGYNTVRIFLDSCGCIAEAKGLRADTLDVIAEIMGLAAEHGLVLILTSNDLPDEGGFRMISNQANSEHFPGYRNTDLLTAAGHEAMRTYWDELLGELVERRAAFEAVLGWSILNEQWTFTDMPPLSLAAGTVKAATGSYDMSLPDNRRAMVVDSVRAMIAAISEVIRSHDPHGLVTMGFFTPQFPNPTGIGGTWYVDTAPLVVDSDLDFFDFHAYPGQDLSIELMAENFGVDDRKPVVMGEVGAFVDRYPAAEDAALAVQDWIARSCAVGFDGWVYWGFLRAPLDDATWALTDSDVMQLALAPLNQPDPCVATLEDPNLAAERPVSASRSLPEEPPEAAVDGSTGTQWGSGADAPQWIEVNLGGVTVGRVRLTVGQWPAGRTVHEVAVRTGGGLTVVHTFDGQTEGGDVLEVTLDEPIFEVEAIRITTRGSPSWVAWHEIEVFES